MFCGDVLTGLKSVIYFLLVSYSMFNDVVAGLAGSTIPDEIHNLSSVFQVYPVVFYKLDMSGNLFSE